MYITDHFAVCVCVCVCVCVYGLNNQLFSHIYFLFVIYNII